jgi:hypothetical protein
LQRIAEEEQVRAQERAKQQADEAEVRKEKATEQAKRFEQEKARQQEAEEQARNKARVVEEQAAIKARVIEEQAAIKAQVKQAETAALVAFRNSNPGFKFGWGALMNSSDLDHVTLDGVILVDGQVTELSMNDSGVADIPNLAEFSALTEVWFSNNLLTANSLERFCRTPPLNLAILGLEHCELEVLPDSIVWLPHLKDLYLARNRLKQLPGEIGQLRSLQHLTAADNELTEVEKRRIREALPNCRALIL